MHFLLWINEEKCCSVNWSPFHRVRRRHTRTQHTHRDKKQKHEEDITYEFTSGCREYVSCIGSWASFHQSTGNKSTSSGLQSQGKMSWITWFINSETVRGRKNTACQLHCVLPVERTEKVRKQRRWWVSKFLPPLFAVACVLREMYKYRPIDWRVMNIYTGRREEKEEAGKYCRRGIVCQERYLLRFHEREREREYYLAS